MNAALAARMDIRPLTTADEPLLWEMLYHALFVPEGSERPSPDIVYQPELARYVQEWGREGDLGFKAVKAEDKAVGAVWLRLLTGDQRGYGYISDTIPELTITLLPDYRGQGIGGELMSCLLAAASKQFDAISLSVSEENPATYLYQRFGFDVVASEGASYIMKLDLKQP